jgi:hypothetical protein
LLLATLFNWLLQEPWLKLPDSAAGVLDRNVPGFIRYGYMT